MTVTPLDAPRPLPAVPCPVYDGHPIEWQEWSPLAPMTHIDPSCDSCAFRGPLSMTFGKSMPLPGEMFDSTQSAIGARTGRTYQQRIQVPAWPVTALSARLCPSCLDLTVFPLGPPGTKAAPSILCDGCDALVAIGATDDEARRTLVDVYGGWTSPGADWDLCRQCNPAATPDAPPRALAAFAASRRRAPKRKT